MKIRDVMTPAPIGLSPSASVAEAARAMREEGIGDVLVVDAGRLFGIVTDRDIVVRTVAEGLSPETTRLDEICSPKLIVVAPDDDVTEAIRVVSKHAVLRIPVAEGETAVGVVSLSDLALQTGERSVLSDVASAPPNT
jgi:CBS domain-containing protein